MLDKRKNIATLQWGQDLFKNDKILDAILILISTQLPENCLHSLQTTFKRYIIWWWDENTNTIWDFAAVTIKYEASLLMVSKRTVRLEQYRVNKNF